MEGVVESVGCWVVGESVASAVVGNSLGFVVVEV